MKSIHYAVIAVGGIAVLSLAVALRSGAGKHDAPSSDVRRLRDEVRALSRQISEFKEEPPRPAPAPVPVQGPDLEALEERIDSLETQVNRIREATVLALQAKGVRLQPEVLTVPAPPKPPDAQELARLQAAAMDPTKSAEDRLQALARLRRVPDARTRGVVTGMLRLFETSTNSDVRVNILRNLHRALPLDLKGPVIRALQSDPEREIREEAAETLGPHINDPVVRAALEHASRNDVNEKVREEAADSLRGKND